MDLKMDVLPLFGGFSMIKALRPLNVNITMSLIVQFIPHEEQYFEETLRIYSSISTVSVKLKGKGVKYKIYKFL